MGPSNFLIQELHSELQQTVDNSEYAVWAPSLCRPSSFSKLRKTGPSVIKQLFPAPDIVRILKLVIEGELKMASDFRSNQHKNPSVWTGTPGSRVIEYSISTQSGDQGRRTDRPRQYHPKPSGVFWENLSWGGGGGGGGGPCSRWWNFRNRT